MDPAPEPPPAVAAEGYGGFLAVETWASVASGGAAEASLRFLDGRRGALPGAAGALVGGLGADAGDRVGDVMLKAVESDGAHAAIPLAGLAAIARAITEGLARPARRCDDVALGELVAQLVRVA